MAQLTRLIAFGVFCTALTSLLLFWVLFAEMWIHGRTTTRIATNRYGEFWLEFAVWSLAVIFAPVLVYEVDAVLFADS